MLQFATLSIFFGIVIQLYCVQGHFLILGEQSIRPQSDYHVTIATSELTEPIHFLIYLNCWNTGQSFLKDITVPSKSFVNVTFQIGDVNKCPFQLNTMILSETFFAPQSQSLEFIPNFFIKVQTNKGMYKPGDLIQFRVLVLEKTSKPYIYSTPLNIFMIDANGNRVKQWLNVKTLKGVFSKSFKLSDAPLLGKWKFVVELQGQSYEKSIEIEEYVLPPFKVSIEVPPNQLIYDTTLKATIRANYSYGKEVEAYGEVYLCKVTDEDNTDYTAEVLSQQTLPQFKNSAVVKLEGKKVKKGEHYIIKAELTDSYGRKQTGFANIKKESEPIPYRTLVSSKPVMNSNGVSVQLITKHHSINSYIIAEVTVDNNVEMFFYLLVANGRIIKSEAIQTLQNKKVDLRFVGTLEMIPEAQLIVYNFGKDGKPYSARLYIPFKEGLPITINVNVSNPSPHPGEEIQITVTAERNSYVALLGIDQSVLYHKKDNDLHQAEILKNITYDPKAIDTFIYLRTFTTAGITAITKRNQEKKDSFHSPASALAQVIISSKDHRTGFESNLPIQQTRIRKSFVETLMFDDFYDIGIEGEVTITKKMPDTITSWYVSGLAVHPQKGLGLIQQENAITVFQPFFVTLELPYSVKKDELLTVFINIHNYLETSQTVNVTFFNEYKEFEFVDLEPLSVPRAKFRTKTVDVLADNGINVSFKIRPTRIGHIKIKVLAKSTDTSDGIERQLLVTPEGVTQYVNEVIPIDMKSQQFFFKSLSISMPENIVPGSTRIEMSIYGYALIPTIKNLDNLIKKPSGCGEQNLIRLVPNIVVLDYLTSVSQLTRQIKQKAIEHMEFGYQNQLKYRHEDGSFSTWGQKIPKERGNTWLTAYVAKTFIQASRYITVDDNVVKKALKFLTSVQGEDGQFNERGNILSMRNIQEIPGHRLALTAYVLTVFLEIQDNYLEFRDNINRATNYLVKNIAHSQDTYVIALTAYALQLANHVHKDEILRRLDNLAIVDNRNNLKYWQKVNSPNAKPISIDIEITAYALLAFIESESQNSLMPIVNWLLKQRNENGGFQSTQDTVVGLQALAKVGSNTVADDNNIEIDLVYENGLKNVDVNLTNSKLLQSFLLPSNIRMVNITATGTGYAVAQLSYKFNINENGTNERFTLSPKINIASNSIKVCTNYIPKENDIRSNMAVMEIELPSGYTADLGTTRRMVQNNKVTLFETKNNGNKAVLYFDFVSRQLICPEVKFIQQHEVQVKKSSSVIMFDYYDDSRQAKVTYQI